MSRYDKLFSNKKFVFIPFLTLGDQDYDYSLKAIKSLIDNGVDGLELGFPFSDPIADGPIIQKANIRALKNGITTNKCWLLLDEIRKYNKDIPIGLLIYSNLIFAYGLEEFFKKSAEVAIDSILIIDVPSLEQSPFKKLAEKYKIDIVNVISPNTTIENAIELAVNSGGYSYVMSRLGVTGATTTDSMSNEKLLAEINKNNGAKPIIGFGISSVEQVAIAKKIGASGVIVGSKLISSIMEANVAFEDIDKEIKKFIGPFVKEANKN